MKFTESENIELKKSTAELKEGIISIAAILNKHGKGELYFGIKNNGIVVGQDVGDKTLRDVSQAISNHIEPKIYPEITKEKINNLHIIKVQFQGNDKPYFAYGRVYLRVADEDRQLSPKEIEKLILEKNIYQSKWDSEITEYTLFDVNDETVSGFIDQLISSGRIPVQNKNKENIFKKLGLISKNKLSFAAWHLFCDYQPVELQLAVFKNNDKTSFSDIKPPIKGNLFFLLETAIEYVLDKMNWRVEFSKDMKRHEIPEIPVAALREAIVNSFAHRDFHNPKSNEIAFFDNRIEIFNPGTFPPGLTPDNFIKGHERSHLRNPKIAEIFFYTRNIDRWGSGLQRIDKECRENKIKYSFQILSDGFLVTFYRPNFREKTREKTRGKTRGKIIEIIKNNPSVTIHEMATITGITIKGIEWQIAKLKQKGIIKRVGPAKGGHWVIVDDDVV